MAYQPPPRPKETSQWFKRKGIVPSFDWTDVWQEEHAIAFTVAKGMEFDVLENIKQEVQKAINQGTTFNDFKKNLKPVLKQLGWWGQKDMTDPSTGETKRVQLGSTRRLKTIFDTNLRTARAAGQWERIQRTQKALPYLVYELGPSENHRAQHVRWSRLVLRADDPFWQKHFPPNGWGCKCRVRQISAMAARKLGITKAPPTTTKDWVNKRTGEVVKVPEGIDPGWDYNPGIDRLKSLDQHNYDKSPELASMILASPIRAQHYQSWVSKVINTGQTAGRLISAGVISSGLVDWVAKTISKQQAGIIGLPDKIVVGVKAARHTNQGNALQEKDWVALPKLLAAPKQTLWDTKNKTIIYVVQSDKGVIKVAVRSDGTIATAYYSDMKEIDNLVKDGVYVEVK